MKKIVYKVEGLDCASCAAKIEDKAKTSTNIKNINIDLMSNNVFIEMDESFSELEIINDLNKIADIIEPGSKFVKEESIKEAGFNYQLLRILISVVLLVLSFIFNKNEALLLITYLLVGYDVIILAFKNIVRLQMLDEHFLMSIATIGAVLINEYFEAVLVMLLYQIGEYLQDYAVDQSKRSISKLMDLKSEYAIKVVDNQEVKVLPEEILVDDIIIVRPGEKIALDGVVVEGSSNVDTKALTGESLLSAVSVDSEVLSGSINVDGVIKIKVSKIYSMSTVAKILDLVENASSQKAQSENFITKFAKYYTPIVVIMAIMLGFVYPLVVEKTFYSYKHVYQALTFLVISCPCALVISVPLGFFAGIGGISKKGVLFKGSNYIEALANSDTILFDKTGTLTKGNLSVSEIISGYDHDDVLKIAYIGEYYSNHPIAKSIINKKAYSIDKDLYTDVEEIFNQGMKVVYNNEVILVGNAKLMEAFDVDYQSVNHASSIVYVAKNNQYYGAILIEDVIKEESYQIIENLHNNGIKEVAMLTGDNKHIAQDVAERLNIDNYYAELYPDDKYQIVQDYINKGYITSFVGDGINDAPVLTLANVGIGMGILGSDAAIEASDVVIMDDNLDKIVLAKVHAKRVMKIVKENIIFALSVKFLFLVLGMLGLSNMAMAVFADVGVSLIAILNSLRLLNVKE